MCNKLKANESKGFVIQHSRIQVERIIFLDTRCSGKFCDCQNVLLNSNKLCGLSSLISSRSNIISMHSICFSTDTGKTKTMSEFSSLKFLETSTKRNLSVEICASRLQSDYYAYGNVVDAFDEIVDLVNSEGGWNIYG